MAKRLSPEKIELMEKAKELFLAGFTLKVIAEKLEQKENTIKIWSFRENWAEDRRKIIQDAKEQAIMRLAEVVEETQKRYLVASARLAELVITEVNQIEAITEKNVNFVYKLAKILVAGSSTLRNANPEVSNTVAENLLKNFDKNLGR